MSNLELKIPPVLLTVIFAILMWLISLQFSGIPSPIQIKLMTFVALAGIGAFFFVASGMSFIKAKTTVNPMTPDETSSLVTSGIYKHTRNPMYLGCLFILIGWGLFLSNLYSLALSVGFVPYMNRFQILPEERALESIFGAEFLAYKERVRRWL